MGKSRGRGGRGRGRGRPSAGKDVEDSSEEEEDVRRGGARLMINEMIS